MRYLFDQWPALPILSYFPKPCMNEGFKLWAGAAGVMRGWASPGKDSL